MKQRGETTMKSFVFIIGMLLTIPSNAEAWQVRKSVDEMDNSSEVFAMTGMVNPKAKLGFPYEDLKSNLTYSCRWGQFGSVVGSERINEAIIFSFNHPANIGGDRKVRVKIGDTPSSFSVKQRNGVLFAIISSGDAVLMGKSDFLLVELSWGLEGNVYFKYPLSGFKQSRKEVIKSCRKA